MNIRVRDELEDQNSYFNEIWNCLFGEYLHSKDARKSEVT